MGIVEGYSADLYCDCDACQSGRECRPKYIDLAGDSRKEIDAQAKIFGWTITKDRMNCYAPGHKPKRR